MIVTEKCDVFTFGVVVIETIMGKHPGELISSLSSSIGNNILLKDVLDPRLLPPIDRFIQQDVMFIVKLALACLCSNSQSRPTMQHVSHELVNHKRFPQAFDRIRLCKLKDFEIEKSLERGRYKKKIIY